MPAQKNKIASSVHNLFFLCTGISLALLFSACSKPRHTVEEVPRNPALEGIYRAAEGGIVALRPPTDGLTVLFFYSRECPIANFYLPVVNELVARHGTERIRWAGVCVDPDVTAENQRMHAQDYRIAFPVIADPSGELAASVGAKFTPEVVVFDAQGRQIYRGRIDDHYAARGLKAAKPESHDLDNAVKAGLEGKLPEVRETEAIGCPMPEIAPNKETKITYTEHIAPLIYRSCLECHRPGSIAPFSLETYQQARRRADDLADVTASRFMPPSRLDPKFGQRVQHDISLSDSEIALFEKWAEQGAVEGDPKLMPEKPKFPEGWALGKPDLVLEMPEPFTLPATGRDILRCFPIPTGLTEDQYVSGIEIQPGNSRVVHHLINYIVTSGAGTRKDEADPGPGYDCFGGPGATIIGELGSWGPGIKPDRLPSGLARRLPANSDLILNMHYSPTGKEETDRSRIGIFFSKEPVRQSLHWMLLLPEDFRIPPGASNYELSASREVPMDLMVHMVMPHMHLLGKDMTVWFEKPDGTRVDLLRADPWDFKWQRSYYLMEPVLMPKGSVVRIVGHYDNSSGNPANPFRAEPREIRPGEQTSDEMLACVLGVTKVGQNLVRDGYETDTALFASDWERLPEKSGWLLWAAPAAGPAKLASAVSAVRIEFSESAEQVDAWQIQVKYPVGIRAGENYEVSLKLKADAPRRVTWGVLQNHRPYDHLSPVAEIEPSTEWQTFRKSFTSERGEPDAQIVLAGGGSAVPLDIGEISISTKFPETEKEALPGTSDPSAVSSKTAE
jgi:hypothetical protein